MKKVFKILGYILFGLLLLWGLTYLLWQWYYTSEDEVFVLPDDFEGAVIVLYDEKDGQPEKYDEKGNRVYTIPENGILKTKFNSQDGWRDIKYTRKNGTPLRYLWPPDDVWGDTINNRSIYKDSIYVYKATSRGDFLVGKPKQIDSLWNVLEDKWKPF